MANNLDGMLAKKFAKSSSGIGGNTPELQNANLSNEILISRLMKLGNLTRNDVVLAIKAHLDEISLVYNKTDLSHVAVINEFLSGLLYEMIVIINDEPGNGMVFKIDTIDITKFLSLNISEELSVLQDNLPVEVVNFIRRLS